MTRLRQYGDDTPFGAWIREQRDLDSHTQGLYVCDTDWLIHRFKPVIDGQGSREINFAMIIEVKTRGGLPWKSQQETLWFHHQRLSKNQPSNVLNLGGQGSRCFWHFGVFVLSLPKDRPDESETVSWLTFDSRGELTPHVISTVELPKILRFDTAPDTLQAIRLRARRHHKVTEFAVQTRTKLGFDVLEKIKKRS